jgi:hypothetical protein
METLRQAYALAKENYPVIHASASLSSPLS